MIYKMERPIKAIWKSKDFDLPVTLIQLYIHEDNRIFFAIEESNTCIPHDQVEFKKGEDPVKLVMLD